MKYLNLPQILATHEKLIIHFGGTQGVRDKNLLKSAIARPKASAFGQEAYPHLFMKASVLMHSIIKNHPFLDGNKRTGFAAMHMMLMLNGYDLTASPEEAYHMCIQVASGQLVESEIVDWIKKYSKNCKRRRK